jgi:hypothetical protein
MQSLLGLEHNKRSSHQPETNGRSTVSVIAGYGVPGSIKRVATGSAPPSWPGEMVVVSGKASAGQVITITDAIPGGDQLVVTYPPQNDESPETAATNLTSKINSDPGMKAAGISASASGGIVMLRTPPGAVALWSASVIPAGSMAIAGPIP